MAFSYRSDNGLCHYSIARSDCVSTATNTNPWMVYIIPAEPSKAPTYTTETCDTPWNRFENLTPPGKSMWRGSTSETWTPYGLEQEYGYPLHIFRKFAGPGWHTLRDYEIEHIDRGGILWYGIAFNNWADVISGAHDAHIDQFADVFFSVAPANMFLCLRWEADLYVDPSDEKYYGTPEEYVQMWHYVYNKFESLGVTNAVWSTDWSAQISRDNAPLYAAMWPGSDYVDWNFWNLFWFGPDVGRSVYDMTTAAYEIFEASEPQVYEGVEYTPDYNLVDNWGLGAWGASATAFTDEERAALLNEIAEYFDQGTFPKIRAQIYFNSGDEKNTGTTSEISGELTTEAYVSMLGARPMVKNDACRENWDVQTSGEILQDPPVETAEPSDVTYVTLASAGEVACTGTPYEGWNNHGNQETAEDCAMMCAADEACVAITFNHARGQCTGWDVECVVRDQAGNEWTIISIVRGSDGGEVDTGDEEVSTGGEEVDAGEEEVDTGDETTGEESSASSDEIAALQQENAALREQVNLLQSQMDMVFEYLQCSLDEGCGRYPSSEPSAPPSAFAAPYIGGMKCPFSGGVRSFKIQGSWVNMVSCGGTCEKRDDCNYFSIWESDDAFPMCIGCAVEPMEYDPRFQQTYKLFGSKPNFCEINHTAESGMMCDRSRDQQLFQANHDDVYACVEACEDDESCRYAQFTWFDANANGKAGWCRGLTRCDLVPNDEDNSMAKAYIVGESC